MNLSRHRRSSLDVLRSWQLGSDKHLKVVRNYDGAPIIGGVTELTIAEARELSVELRVVADRLESEATVEKNALTK